MKKRIILCSLLCLALLIMVVGCSQKNNTQPASTASTGSQVQSGNGGGQPMAAPDIFGQVKEIKGDSITIDLAQLPQRPQNQNGQNYANQPQNPPGGGSGTGAGAAGNQPRQRGQWSLKLTGESKTITIPEGAKIYSSGFKRSMGQGTAQGQPQAPAAPGAQQGQQGSQQGPPPGQGPQEIKIGDIKAGDSISVYYKAGTETVERVMVRSASPQQ